MAKLKAHGHEILRFYKENQGDGDLTDWERNTTAYMSDGVVLTKLDVNFKAERYNPRHSYGWKRHGKLRAGVGHAELAALRDRAIAKGYVIEVDLLKTAPVAGPPAAPAIA